tara:strand:+ start:414 stop:521 length:108 start_codon:yes stop_codon:yes gene_type:complete
VVKGAVLLRALLLLLLVLPGVLIEMGVAVCAAVGC